jgi:hypothetical protein
MSSDPLSIDVGLGVASHPGLAGSSISLDLVASASVDLPSLKWPWTSCAVRCHSGCCPARMGRQVAGVRRGPAIGRGRARIRDIDLGESWVSARTGSRRKGIC